MSNLTADKIKQVKENLSHGEIAVGQNTRASTLELILPKKPTESQKSEDEMEEDDEEEIKSEDLVAEFSFSSEYPVLRYDWWKDERFYEVLSHQKEHVNTSRIEGGVCPLLWNHDRNVQRGIIQSVKFTDGRATCKTQYDDDEEGRSLHKKMMQGTRRGISFMYQVYEEYEEMKMEDAVKFLKKYGLTDKKFYPVRVSKNWEIFEISHVSIPADHTIGVGKSATSEETSPIIITVKNYSNLGKELDMSKSALQEVKELEKASAPVVVVEQEKEVVEEAPAQEKASSFLTPEMVKEFISQALAPTQERVQTLEAQNLELSAEKEALTQALELEKEEKAKAQQTAEAFRDISKLIGKPAVEMPAVNLLTNPSRTEPHGLAREFLDIFNSSDADPKTVRHEQMVCTQRNHVPLARFMNQHFAEERSRGITDWRRSALVKDLEQYFKDQGLLSGKAAGPTIGSSASIGSIYLDVLSTMMRETHNANNIWWQFTTTVYDPSSAPNKTVLIPRTNLLPAPTDVNDFLLATTDTYNSVNYVRGTGTDSQSLEITTVPVTIRQWGLGLSTIVGNRPVFIPEFHEATSLISLMELVDSRLMQHYYSFEDLMVRKEYFKATTIYYNDAGEVTTVPANVAASNDGTLTEAFLDSVYAQLYAAQWPTLVNNCYVLLVPPQSLKNLKRSLDKQYAPVTEEQRMAISGVLRAATGIELGQSYGYVGQYNGFEIFSGNTWGVGAPGGSNPTVNTTTFGAGATITEDCFVFTAGAVGRGIALPMEIRASGTTPFQMGESFIWISREETAPVDLDATLAPTGSQQTRVAKLRVARTAV